MAITTAMDGGGYGPTGGHGPVPRITGAVRRSGCGSVDPTCGSAMLTGGGDCPGLNAVMRAVVRKGERDYGDELIGFLDGWTGVIERRPCPSTWRRCRGTLPRGGTILGSSRTNPFTIERRASTSAEATLDATSASTPSIAIGGEDTLGVAAGCRATGVPSSACPRRSTTTSSATELTFGFDTAVQIAIDAIDRLHTTAESHDRVMVVEVMGRHAGHIATWAGIAGGATMMLIPEEPFDIDAVCDGSATPPRARPLASIVVVAEGAEPKEGTMEMQSGEVDPFGHVRLGGVATRLAEEIEERTGFETRVDHPRPRPARRHPDRLRPGARPPGSASAAIDAVHDGAWGQMVALQRRRIVRVPLSTRWARPELVDLQLFHDVAELFFALTVQRVADDSDG